jgi:aldose 1-epimerase
MIEEDMNISRRQAITAVAGLGLASCAKENQEPEKKKSLESTGSKTGKVDKQSFGKTSDGQAVDLYTLTNSGGASVAIMNYGGIVVSLKVPDRSGAMGDVVLGFDTFDPYLTPPPYFGALIGRYGNRIAKGRFKLNGVEYKLAVNNGPNALHGGLRGFDKALWTVKDVSSGGVPSLELNNLSKDGEEGYPGNLNATVTYTWTDAKELKIDYAATTDKDTVLNLTNHSYFNLAGEGQGDILAHEVMIDADRFTPVDSGLIPTGELKPVEGTPFDFRKPTAIGARIDAKDEQIKYGGGYDHNFVLNHPATPTPLLAAKVTDPKSGRVMEVLTTEPGLQFYTGNFLDGKIKGKGGKTYVHRGAFCMETQHFPDSPNKPSFPTTVLKPGAKYQSSTIYRFS